jgi:hypothetical protein
MGGCAWSVLIGLSHESKRRAAAAEAVTAVLFGAEQPSERDSYGTHCSAHVGKPTLVLILARNQDEERIEAWGGSETAAIHYQA